MIKKVSLGLIIILLMNSCGFKENKSPNKDVVSNYNQEELISDKTHKRISPILVGTNVWYINPSDEVWDLTKKSGVTSIRIGGHAYDKKIPSKEELIDWVSKIQNMGAEPILQISQYAPENEASELVKLFNKDLVTGKPIKFWNPHPNSNKLIEPDFI